jgi:hypothetical protein
MVGIAILVPSAGLGAELVLPLSEGVVIANARGESRVLFRFDRLDALREELVTSAWVSLPLPGLVPMADVNVEIYGLATSWEGRQPTWNTPWSTPGGDIEDTDSFEVTLYEGERVRLLRLDVTHMIRGMVEGTFPENGFILTARAGGREGFTALESAVLGGLQGGKLIIDYRKLTAHGLRGGAKALLERKRAAEFEGGR